MRKSNMMSTSVLQGTLDGIIKYLGPFSSLINCHMVNYITDDHWRTYVPQDIQNEMQTAGDIEEALDVFWDSSCSEEKSSKFPNFLRFIEEGKKFTYDCLTDTWLDGTRFRDVLREVGCTVDADDCLKIKEFMSEKKKHEVEETTKLISILCTYGRQNAARLSVIDAGDGKGYLSSRLALEYKLKVLGIDASSENSENALKRNARLEKAWGGLTKRAEDIQNGIVPPRKGRRNRNTSSPIATIETLVENYKTTTHYITPQTNFVELFNQFFPHDNPNGFCLSGLHTCGNLASSCLKIFAENSDLDVVCNVGCCYHLLSEEFSVDEFFDNRKMRDVVTDAGFPLSKHLRNKEFKFGRNARMLAAQSVHRFKHEKGLPQISLFWRAILETLVTEKYPEQTNSVQVGKLKKTENFVEYVRAVCKKTELNFDSMSDDELLQLEQSLAIHRHRINLFYLLRMTFAPVIETLILLDRLLFLREREIPNSFLVKLFDPIVSPRCFAIVSLKR